MNDPMATAEEDGGARLALEFRADAFLLHRHAESGWREVAAAPLEAPITPPDFDAAISRIAEAARALSGAEAPPVELWLPPDRIFLVALEPGETPEDALRDAPAPLADLVCDLSADGGALAAAELSVVEDGIRYAQLWGFAPTRVTARVAPEAFPAGPDFAGTSPSTPTPLAPVSTFRRLAPGLAVAGAALVVALGAFLFAPALSESDAPPALEVPARLALVSSFDARVAVPPPAEPARPEAPAPAHVEPEAGAPKPRSTAPAPTPRLIFVDAPAAPPAAEAALISAKSPDAPLVFAALRPPVGTPARAATGPRIETSPEAPPPEAPASAAAESPAAPAQAVSQAEPPPAPIVYGPGAIREAPPPPAPRPPEIGPSGAPPAAAPGDAPPAARDAEAGPSETPPAEAPAPETSPAEEVDDGPPGPGAVARAPVPKTRPDALDMTPSDNVATRSPAPAPRPKSIRRRALPVAVEIGAKGVRAVRAPKRGPPQGPGVANAATLKNAIRLEEMNLLGVFGADGARRALLRLPDGQVLRVTRGAVVEGWVVSRIDATSMRITRGGEARVLDLAQ